MSLTSVNGVAQTLTECKPSSRTDFTKWDDPHWIDCQAHFQGPNFCKTDAVPWPISCVIQKGDFDCVYEVATNDSLREQVKSQAWNFLDFDHLICPSNVLDMGYLFQ